MRRDEGNDWRWESKLTPSPSFGSPEFRPRRWTCRTAAVVYHRRWTVVPPVSTGSDAHPVGRSGPQLWRRGRTPSPTGTASSPAFGPRRNARPLRTDLQLLIQLENQIHLSTGTWGSDHRLWWTIATRWRLRLRCWFTTVQFQLSGTPESDEGQSKGWNVPRSRTRK